MESTKDNKNEFRSDIKARSMANTAKAYVSPVIKQDKQLLPKQNKRNFDNQSLIVPKELREAKR